MTIFQPNHRIFHLPTWIIFWLVLPTMAGTLKDDFNDGNLDGWTHECVHADKQLNRHPCKTRVGDSIWQVEKGVLTVKVGELDEILFITVGEENWKNYTVSIRTRIVKHQPFHCWGESAGLVLRVSSPLDFYMFGIGTVCLRPKTAQAYYLKEIFGIKHLETARFEWEIGKWYKLQIEAKGNQFKYYIDGKLVINYTDGSHSTGKIGIWGGVHSTTYHYDDFTVTGGQVSDLNLSVSPQSRLATVWAQVKSVD